MKSQIRINLAAKDWKTTGSAFTARNGNGRGGYYRGGTTYNVPKAIMKLVESFEDQGIVPAVSYTDEYATIEAYA